MGRPWGFFNFSEISGGGKEHFRRFSWGKQKARLVNETQRCAVISNIGRHPTSLLTASLVDLWLTPRTNLQRCKLSFSMEWGSSTHFTKWLLAQFDFEMKYGPQTSMPYVITGNTNNDIVNWACWDGSICFHAKNALQALSCKAAIALVKEPHDEKTMPK